MLIIGCGYVGERLARQYLDLGRPVQGLVRSAEGFARLSTLGIDGIRKDLASDDLGDIPLEGAQVFHLAPPPGRGVEDTHTHRLVAAFPRAGQPRRVVYVSTTGVYGDCRGAWVDESWPIQPSADRARRRWDAEQTLRRWSQETGGELVILRVAGIYGPDRLPLERIRQGLPLVRPEEAPFTNRIHVVDLVAALEAAMERAPSGGLYNACDGHPSTMTDYFLAVAGAAGLPPPPLIPLAEASGQLSEGMLSYLAESRRLSNRRLIEGLGLSLRYPTLADGLRELDRSARQVTGPGPP
jgi:nucleoside-diphosphate-sugar epimerase